jgi:antitoxin HicB
VLYFSRMKVSTRTYTLLIDQYPEGYLAYFPALQGCHTWGKTYEDAIKHAEEAVRLYLASLAAHGDPWPEDSNQNPVSLGITVRASTIA